MAARKVATKTSKAKTKKKAAPKKKAVAKRKVGAKKAAPTKASRTAVRERYKKTQIVNEIAESTQLSRGQVNSVLDELSDIIESHIKKRAVGEFTLPGLLKIKTVKKPARKARKNVPNPFRPGETMNVAAKPASTTVKVLALKKLKGMAQ